MLNALRAHDEVLAENLDSLRYQLGRYGRVMDPLPGKIIIDLPVSVGIEFVNAIETKIISTTAVSWNFWYGLLEKFTASEGHARPPKPTNKENASLGGWVAKQRSFRVKLTPEQVSRLEALPGWTWNVPEFQWEEGFLALQRFTAREGHASPMKGHKERGYSLGNWVTNQRK